jgi:8-oxo-dGDP phosphatase
VAAVLAGELHNPILIMGALACAATRGAGFRALRPADVDWQARENLPHH